MANRNTAGFGLQPVMRVGNTPAIQGQSAYEIDAAETNAIYNGEPVKIDLSTSTGGYIVTAAAGTAAVGVLNGVFYNAATTLKPTWVNYYPAAITPANSEDITAFVNDDPMGLWIGNVDVLMGASQPAAIVAAVGQTMGTGTSSGSTINGRSNVTLTFGTIDTVANSWRLLRVVEDPSNSDMTAAFCSVVVVQNLNQIINSAA